MQVIEEANKSELVTDEYCFCRHRQHVHGHASGLELSKQGIREYCDSRNVLNDITSSRKIMSSSLKTSCTDRQSISGEFSRALEIDRKDLIFN